MKLEETGFGGVFDLDKPEWQGEAYKAYAIQNGVVLLPLSDEFPTFPSKLGSIFYGAYLIAKQEMDKHEYQSFSIGYEHKIHMGNYPHVVIQFVEKG